MLDSAPGDVDGAFGDPEAFPAMGRFLEGGNP